MTARAVAGGDVGRAGARGAGREPADAGRGARRDRAAPGASPACGRRSSARGSSWRERRESCASGGREIVLGLLVAGVAVSPWTDSAADSSLRAHMLQHLALLLVAAPLLVLGSPRRGALRALPRPLARAALALGHPVRRPVAFAAAELGTHFTPLYDLAARNTACARRRARAAPRAGSALLVGRLGPATSLAARVLLLLFAMPVHAVVGVVLLLDDRPRYAAYPSLADQHDAAALDWSLGSMLLGAALALAGWRWVATEQRRTLAGRRTDDEAAPRRRVARARARPRRRGRPRERQAAVRADVRAVPRAGRPWREVERPGAARRRRRGCGLLPLDGSNAARPSGGTVSRRARVLTRRDRGPSSTS